MNPSQEVLSANDKSTFEFFLYGLRDLVPEEFCERKRVQQPMFVASVLAHYAATSTASTHPVPALPAFTNVLDNFVFCNQELMGPHLCEIAGSHCLIFNGIFRKHTERRHNTQWVDDLGRGFFRRASYTQESSAKQELLGKMSVRFTFWAETCKDLTRKFYEDRYLIQLN